MQDWLVRIKGMEWLIIIILILVIYSITKGNKKESYPSKEFSENTEKQFSEAINSIPSTWVRKFSEDLNMEDWFLDIDAYISKNYRDIDGKKKESQASINFVKERIEANYFENTIEIQMFVVMCLCRLNISDRDYCNCILIIDKWRSKRMIRELIVEEWEDFFTTSYMLDQDRLPPDPYINI